MHNRQGSYFLPCDDREIRRLEVYHHIFLQILGGDLYTAPLKDPKRILDIGCGAGEWCVAPPPILYIYPCVCECGPAADVRDPLMWEGGPLVYIGRWTWHCV